MSPIKKERTALLASIIVLLFFEAVFSTEPAQVGMPAPGISGQTWLNSEPLRIAELKGKR